MATNAFLSPATEIKLGNKGLVVTVYDDDNVLGRLMVGKASLVWFEKGAKKRGRRATWEDFRQDIMKKPLVDVSRP